MENELKASSAFKEALCDSASRFLENNALAAVARYIMRACDGHAHLVGALQALLFVAAVQAAVPLELALLGSPVSVDVFVHAVSFFTQKRRQVLRVYRSVRYLLRFMWLIIQSRGADIHLSMLQHQLGWSSDDAQCWELLLATIAAISCDQLAYYGDEGWEPRPAPSFMIFSWDSFVRAEDALRRAPAFETFSIFADEEVEAAFVGAGGERLAITTDSCQCRGSVFLLLPRVYMDVTYRLKDVFSPFDDESIIEQFHMDDESYCANEVYVTRIVPQLVGNAVCRFVRPDTAFAPHLRCFLELLY